MEPSEYKKMYAVEERHWWYEGMRAITQAALGGFSQPRHDSKILDAGCGTGGGAALLSKSGAVYGCDYSHLALRFCQQRSLKRLSRGSVSQLPFRDGAFDLVTSFDVLYHREVRDYHIALSEFRRVLKPSGLVFLRLPAYNWLRGRHDRRIHTARRFHALELRLAFSKVGLEVLKLTYANTILFPVALLHRLLSRLASKDDASDIEIPPQWLNRLMTGALRLESKWLAHGTLPFGLSIIVVGRKPLQGGGDS